MLSCRVCLLCQVSGRQLLLLVPPEQGFQGCYPFPVAHPYDRYSCVDWEEPELQHWPAAAQVRSMNLAAVVLQCSSSLLASKKRQAPSPLLLSRSAPCSMLHGRTVCCLLLSAVHVSLQQVHGMVCELAPGDSLLIPAYWFVQRCA
jgi:hypothetical protein